MLGVDSEGRCGALITYPLLGLPWRRNIRKSVEFAIDESDRRLLFEEVARLRSEHPRECLSNDQLWSDHSERANAISRDRATNTPCVTIGIVGDRGEWYEYFSIRQDSPALLDSPLFALVSRLIQPYETLERVRPN